MASLPRTSLMFSNIYAFAIRSTVYWMSIRIHVRGTAQPVVLCMATGTCPSKSCAPHPLTWNWCQVNSLPSPISINSVPYVCSTNDVNIVWRCPPSPQRVYRRRPFHPFFFPLGALRTVPLHVLPPTAPTLKLSLCATAANMIPVPCGYRFDGHVPEIQTLVAPPGHRFCPRGIERHHQPVHASEGFWGCFFVASRSRF